MEVTYVMDHCHMASASAMLGFSEHERLDGTGDTRLNVTAEWCVCGDTFSSHLTMPYLTCLVGVADS